MVRAIAVDIDDTLNDFTQTLRGGSFAFDPAFGLSPDAFGGFLARVRAGERDPDPRLVTEFSYFRQRIHMKCYELARPRPGAAEFMRALKGLGFRIVLCTRRDLRRAQDCTRAWLGAHGIPFDSLFMASNKVVFCRAWGIGQLVDDDPFNIEHGGPRGVRVYYPLNERTRECRPNGARGFESFEEVLPWIEGEN